MSWNHVVKFGGSVVAAALCFGAQAAGNGIVTKVSIDKQTLGASDDVVVKVTMTNTTSQPQQILKWDTPFGDIEHSLFDVTRDGVPVPYEGMIAKRPAPAASDYFTIQPGKSHTVQIELSSMYNMSVTGEYKIRYKAKGSNKNKQAEDLTSDAVTVYIEGALRRGVMPEAQPVQSLAGGSLSYSKCSASQQSTISSAVAAGTAMASDGDAYLAAGKAGTRYTKWFGAYTSARYNTAKSHFAAIKDAFQNKPITVDCSCNKTYYAYVYPTQPYKIYVCKAFWSAPMTGTDSKGGTLVHEMSHFNVVAGTDDHVYGQSGAAQLAITDPDTALDNADSHEYFGENTPAGN
ncbi:M35 family metallo-endopeptidase [Pseudoduganella ginsengisoli]|uniref:Peptidase M35 n=1 Tax=Pseudoduganella ginsengisoli TaxID=1462440 RepID=A0A6L6Q3Z7_9BURK|nr:M35 family metallo-endopeptidase [Pseudoduganella ginsengisoli]MTW04206.1 peptidase M35 [Pseudoduganella ginsengisoli]